MGRRQAPEPVGLGHSHAGVPQQQQRQTVTGGWAAHAEGAAFLVR
ncbi:hypothetical protein [Streptomyces syringium]